MPVYAATKAAIHSLSLSLRHQLRRTTIKVFEIVPPTVDSDLEHGRRQRHGIADRGIEPRVVAAATLQALSADAFETAVAGADFLRMGARKEPEQVFLRINGDRRIRRAEPPAAARMP